MILLFLYIARNEENPVAIKRRGAEHPDLEKELESWVLEERSVGLMVSDSDIREMALEIAKRDDVAEFRASVGWLVNFKKRHRLSYRSPTHTARKENFTAADDVSVATGH